MFASAAAQGSPRPSAAVDQLLDDTIKQLAGLCERLDATVAKECALSAEGKAFVKLSTRSPKDSKKALAKAEQAYRARMADEPDADENRRWIVLSEEVTKSSAVSSGAEALVLLLDSDRVFEDLEYALRGPPVAKADDAAAADAAGTDEVERTWNMELVARAWDPRLTPQSEFRGIAWDGALTCLCQYFHPLFFEGLRERADEILADVQATYNSEAVKRAVQKLGGHCIIDFAWLGPGEVIIIELNPFDGVALGTFPASTGLFLWEDERDNKIMKGEAPFEFRLREEPLDGPTLRVQCNQDWRAIVSS